MNEVKWVNLKITRGEAKNLMAVLNTYEGKKPQSCNWIIKILNQQLEGNGINPTKLIKN